MIPKPDAQSYTRFLTSVGLFLCVVAVVLPALILRETGVLRLSAAELAGLTPTAEHELERRQRLSRSVAVAAPYGGGLLLIMGLGCIALAIPRMREQEGVSDALSSAELSRLLADQAPADRRETLAREVQEQVVSAEPVSEFGASGPDEPEADPSAKTSETVEFPRGSELARRMRRLDDTEQRVIDRLSAICPPGYGFRQRVRLGGSPPLFLDALMVSPSHRLPDVIVEIKPSSTPSGLAPDIRRSTDQAIAQLTRYRSRTGREAVAWLIVVTPRPGLHAVDEAADVSDVLVTIVARDEVQTVELPRLP